jgi:hypothetical protein
VYKKQLVYVPLVFERLSVPPLGIGLPHAKAKSVKNTTMRLTRVRICIVVGCRPVQVQQAYVGGCSQSICCTAAVNTV